MIREINCDIFEDNPLAESIKVNRAEVIQSQKKYFKGFADDLIFTVNQPVTFSLSNESVSQNVLTNFST